MSDPPNDLPSALLATITLPWLGEYRLRGSRGTGQMRCFDVSRPLKELFVRRFPQKLTHAYLSASSSSQRAKAAAWAASSSKTLARASATTVAGCW